MIVYRILKYEGEPADIAEMFRLSISGEYHPGKLKITGAAVEPRVVEATPMLLFALQQVAGKKWESPIERLGVPPSTAGRSPLHGIGSPMQNAPSESEAVKFLAWIDDMLESGEYDWAEQTLSGIRETVEGSGMVTDRQQRAVDNIENAGHRS